MQGAILLHPLALVGLVALAAPVVIHLLVKREALRVPFPTLRFLRAARAASFRVHRLSDWALLAVRLGILAAAAFALADPVWVSLARTAARQRISRAIVVDASASMDRAEASSGTPLAERARALAKTRAADATTSTTIEATHLESGIDAAREWLDHAPPSRRELLVVSDFQRGAFDAAMLGLAAPDVGIALAPLNARRENGPVRGERIVRGDRELVAEVSPDAGATTVSYVPAAEPADARPLEFAGDVDERRIAAQALRAVRQAGAPAGSTHRIVIVFPHAPDRADFDRRVALPPEPWMADAIERLARNPELVEIASGIGPLAGAPTLTCRDGRCAPIATGINGEPLVAAAADGDRLAIFSSAGIISLVTPALIQAAVAATNPFAYEEREPEAWDPGALHQLERPSGDPPAALFRNETSGAHRTIWMLVLVLIAVEGWGRSATRTKTRSEAVETRVA